MTQGIDNNNNNNKKNNNQRINNMKNTPQPALTKLNLTIYKPNLTKPNEI